MLWANHWIIDKSEVDQTIANKQWETFKIEEVDSMSNSERLEFIKNTVK